MLRTTYVCYITFIFFAINFYNIFDINNLLALLLNWSICDIIICDIISVSVYDYVSNSAIIM